MQITSPYTALTRKEVRSVIDGKSAASRVPVLLHFWTNIEDFGERGDEVKLLIRDYPEDAQFILARMPETLDSAPDDPGYRWLNIGSAFLNSTPSVPASLDAPSYIPAWEVLKESIKTFPDPRYPGLFPHNPKPDGRYRLAGWYCGLFERHWRIRGMENALADFYTNPEGVHNLYRALTDFYLAVIERAAVELRADGVLTNDDLGGQTTPLFSKELFEEFLLPYYRELFTRTHDLDMHFWLHSCGCIEPFLQGFIENGLDVIHPLQRYTMDQEGLRDRIGGKICVWSGLDVQRVIPCGTPEEVRQEVRYLMDTWHRQDGRLIFASGNRINNDCPLENLTVLYDEAYSYGGKIPKLHTPT